MLTVNVKGGTKAGRRVVRDKPKDWACPECGVELRGYWTKCPVDSTPRPE